MRLIVTTGRYCNPLGSAKPAGTWPPSVFDVIGHPELHESCLLLCFLWQFWHVPYILFFLTQLHGSFRTKSPLGPVVLIKTYYPVPCIEGGGVCKSIGLLITQSKANPTAQPGFLVISGTDVPTSWGSLLCTVRLSDNSSGVSSVCSDMPCRYGCTKCKIAREISVWLLRGPQVRPLNI